MINPMSALKLREIAWMRNRISKRLFSLTGIAFLLTKPARIGKHRQANLAGRQPDNSELSPIGDREM